MGRVSNYLEGEAGAAATQIFSRAQEQSFQVTLPLEKTGMSMRLGVTPKKDSLPPAVAIRFLSDGMMLRQFRSHQSGGSSLIEVRLIREEDGWMIANRTKGTRRRVISGCLTQVSRVITSDKYNFGPIDKESSFPGHPI